MERNTALVAGATLVLFWIIAFSPVLVSIALIAAIAVAWCRALDHPG